MLQLIEAFVQKYNSSETLYIWIAKAEDFLAKLSRAQAVLNKTASTRAPRSRDLLKSGETAFRLHRFGSMAEAVRADEMPGAPRELSAGPGDRGGGPCEG